MESNSTTSHAPPSSNVILMVVLSLGIPFLFVIIVMAGVLTFNHPRLETRYATCLDTELEEKQMNLKLEGLDVVAKSQTFEEWTVEHGKGSANLASFVTQQLVCVICLDTFETGTDVRGLPCYHVFHSDCLKVWFLKRNFSCPLCKAPFVDSPVEAEPEVTEPGANV